MFKSGIKPNDLIAEIKTEVDVSERIADSTYFGWLKNLMHLLYSEIIKEQRKYIAAIITENKKTVIPIGYIGKEDNSIDDLRYEDVVSVSIDGLELSPSTLLSGPSLRNTYWKNSSGDIEIYYDDNDGYHTVEVVYNIRPSLREAPETKKGVWILTNEQTESALVIKDYMWDETSTVMRYYPQFVFDLSKIGYTDENIILTTLTFKDCFNGFSDTTFICTKGVLSNNEVGYLFNVDGNTLTISLNDNDFQFPVFGKPGYNECEDNIKEGDPRLSIEFEYKGSSVQDIPLPVEFIELAKCKLRGEGYKLMNDDGQAAKWLNEYNMLLENFKAYIYSHGSRFGR